VQIFHPTNPMSGIIARPPCPECATPMMRSRIEPHGPGLDRRTFECPECSESISEIVNFADEESHSLQINVETDT
jgi:endogenous inhibitor of DNA gyrase (YacG/DUF329 family)